MNKFERLTELLWPWITNLRPSHKYIDQECRELGLPVPSPEGTQAEKLADSLSTVAGADIVNVAQKYLKSRHCSAHQRNALQDIIYEDAPCLSIPKRYRRDLAAALDPVDIVADGERFLCCLQQFWILGDDAFLAFFGESSLLSEIKQHFLRNHDWSVVELFERLGCFDAPSFRFEGFIEALVHAENCPNEQLQRKMIETMNPVLLGCGLEFLETGIEEGYPVFTLVSVGGINQSRPKNIVFASPVKPDIRLRDAVNNDIEIVEHADQVLIYDRPIGPNGLAWSELQAWWSESHGTESNNDSARSLYKRLRSSLPENSPPQQLLFRSYYHLFKDSIEVLPALLPEVWLHWDPKSVKERGSLSLPRFRMDFLMLLPYGIRVVIEVDGKHHYSDQSGNADVGRYAGLVSADRDLKLAGYEVFRFGAAELTEKEQGEELLKRFFEELFMKYRISF
ncbi:MAG: hypothetical protein MI976_11270 [Pseudomonadales bacterium]|nr:hypothetical protein [Pseudomonadales bacterium]